MVHLHHHRTIPQKNPSQFGFLSCKTSAQIDKALSSTVNLGKQLCHSCPAIIPSDPNPVLYKQEWINFSNCLPYRTDSCHIPRTTHRPSPHSLSWSPPLHPLCCAGALLKTGPFMTSTGLSWTVSVAECHAGGWTQVATILSQLGVKTVLTPLSECDQQL